MEVNYNGRPVLKSPKLTADATGFDFPVGCYYQQACQSLYHRFVMEGQCSLMREQVSRR
jgi:hypothetical protein